MDNKRNQMLEEKRRSIEKALMRWATKKSILNVGEQLVFEVRITKTVPVVVGRILDEVEINHRLLPRDEFSHGSRTIWRLTQEDWDKLNKLPWDTHQWAFLAMLCAHDNGPLHRDEVMAQGIEWGGSGSFVRRFNKVLRRAADYHLNRVSGAYYSLKQSNTTPPWGYYAIVKYQKCQEDNSSEA